jgi:hypothetical protein
VWGREVGGQVLTFHLAGINNQNFLMRDDQTGSYWQQISGLAISGPMRGQTLPFIHSDEISVKLWQGEQPAGKVLAPIAKYADEYEAADWDKKMEKMRVVVQFPNSGLPMREQVLGIANDTSSRAFPVKKVLGNKLVLDHIGTESVVLIVGQDDASVRAFHNLLPPRDFYRVKERLNETGDALFTDAQTGSQWNFQGCAVAGQDKGQCLQPMTMIKDYWFDWKNYHPATTIF